MPKSTPPQTRITAGKFKGAKLQSTRSGATRPMSEKLRLAIFNALGDISDLNVLDAFAGTGALGFEAISRSASSVTFCDNSQAAVDTIRQNAASLAVLSQVNIHCITWGMAVIRFTAQSFNIIFVDPPYDQVSSTMLIDALALLAESGIVVVSWPRSHDVPEILGAELVKVLEHGKAQILFFRST